MTDERQIPALADYLVEETWVRDVRVSAGAPWPNNDFPGIVAISCLFELAPTHPDFLPPRAGERVNAHRGSIRFFGVSQLAWSGIGWQTHDQFDDDWWTNLAEFTQSGRHFHLEGTGQDHLGTLDIDADEIEVRLWPELD